MNDAPGAWEVDAQGRRFRLIGANCVEYEPTITIDGIEIPQSELVEFHRRRREAKAKGAYTPLPPQRETKF